MGVIVEIASPYRRCNSCNSDDGVIEITALMRVGKTSQGTQIALCESCAQKLRFALNNRYKGYGEQDG
jgi:RNase P subunit RPR2